jgi:UDP:flavonoid glycosyltransferase YjiC (YdhE family)
MGANSMHEALFHGVPLVGVPHFGDQPQNAERVAALGAGVVIPRGELSAARVTDAVQRVLDDDSFRASARRLSAELRARGGLEAALQVILGAATSGFRGDCARESARLGQ